MSELLVIITDLLHQSSFVRLVERIFPSRGGDLCAIPALNAIVPFVASVGVLVVGIECETQWTLFPSIHREAYRCGHCHLERTDAVERMGEGQKKENRKSDLYRGRDRLLSSLCKGSCYLTVLLNEPTRKTAMSIAKGDQTLSNRAARGHQRNEEENDRMTI